MYISSPHRAGKTDSARLLLDRLFVGPNVPSTSSSTTLPTSETDQTTDVTAHPLFVASYESDSPYHSTESTASRCVINLDNTARTQLGARSDALSGAEWTEGMDFEAELAQAVLDGLGVEMINKREEGEGDEDNA